MRLAILLDACPLSPQTTMQECQLIYKLEEAIDNQSDILTEMKLTFTNKWC